MDYVERLEAKETAIDIASAIGKFFLFILIAVLKIIRFGIYAVSCLIFTITSIFFLFGIYFAITVVSEMMKGVAFFHTQNGGLCLLFFCVPLVSGIIKELTEPD